MGFPKQHLQLVGTSKLDHQLYPLKKIVKSVSTAGNACIRYWLTGQPELIPVSTAQSGHEHSYVSQVIWSLTADNSRPFLHICLTICCYHLYPFINGYSGIVEHCESLVSFPRAKHDNNARDWFWRFRSEVERAYLYGTGSPPPPPQYVIRLPSVPGYSFILHGGERHCNSKCFAQEHSTVTWPSLKSRPLGPESSALHQCVSCTCRGNCLKSK